MLHIIFFTLTCVIIYYLFLRYQIYKRIISKKPQHFSKGIFHNIATTRSSVKGRYIWERLKDLIENKIEKHPLKKLNTVAFKKEDLKNNSYAWFGHSTILMNIDNTTVLTDPIFYPISPLYFGFQSFKYSEKYSVDDLPDIDYVILSHDHYDHLNKKTIKKIAPKTKKFIIPLGVGELFIRMGIPEEKIVEMNWNKEYIGEKLSFTYTPTQHFSGRGLFDRNATLWGSYVITGKDSKVFFSGDSGYFPGFKDIGDNYGPFDLAFIENGAYNESWKDVHMFPHQSTEVAKDLQANITVPIHWGKLSLALHPWFEPIILFTKYAKEKGIKYITPRVGEVFDVDYKSIEWWKESKKTS